MAQADSRAESNIGRYIRHALGVERRLKFRRHEAITITRVDQADEVDSKHGHVEGHGDDDETEDPCKEMFEPDPDSDVACIAQENPELQCSQTANPGNREESNPLDRNRSAETNTSSREPEPPRRPESIRRPKLILIDEGSPAERRHGREDDQRAIQQNQATLRNKPILKQHQRSPQRRSKSLAPSRLQGQKHGRHSQDTANRRQQPHRHIRHPWLQVILPNVLEIKLPIKPRQPSGQCD